MAFPDLGALVARAVLTGGPNNDDDDDGDAHEHRKGGTGGVLRWDAEECKEREECREAVIQNLLQKAIDLTGDGPVPPLARAQIEHVRELVSRKLGVAAASPMGRTVQCLVECEAAIKALQQGLAEHCGYPRDDVAVWEQPLAAACRGVAAVLPRLGYGARRRCGRARHIVVLTPQENAVALQERPSRATLSPPSLPQQQQPRPPPLEMPAAGRAARPGSSAHLGTFHDVVSAYTGSGRRSRDMSSDSAAAAAAAAASGVKKNASVQTTSDGSDGGESAASLRERLRQRDREAKVLQSEKQALQKQVDSISKNLSAKAQAVDDIRAGLYKEVCRLKEQLSQRLAVVGSGPSGPSCGVPPLAPTASAVVAGGASVRRGTVSALDSRAWSAAATPAEVFGSFHAVDRELALQEELLRLREKHAHDRMAWCRDAAVTQQRLKAVVSERARERNRPAAGLSAAQYFAIQDGVELLRGEYRGFTVHVSSLLEDYKGCLKELTAQQSHISRVVDELVYDSRRCKQLEKLTKGALDLLAPMLSYTESGTLLEEGAHPWVPYGNLPDPLGEFLGGDEGAGLVGLELARFKALHSAALLLISGGGGGLGGFGGFMPGSPLRGGGADDGDEEGRGRRRGDHGAHYARMVGLTGARLVREALRLMTKTEACVPEEERGKLHALLRRDTGLAHVQARFQFRLAMYKITVRRLLRALKGKPNDFIRLKVRQYDRRIGRLQEEVQRIKLERRCGPTDSELEERVAALAPLPDWRDASDASPSLGWLPREDAAVDGARSTSPSGAGAAAAASSEAGVTVGPGVMSEPLRPVAEAVEARSPFQGREPPT